MGNPYHDKSGKFTSKGKEGVGGGTKKPKYTSPEISNMQTLLDNLMVSAHRIVENRKKAQEEQERREAKEAEARDYNRPDSFRNRVMAERAFNRAYDMNESNEEMADSIARDLSPEFGSYEQIRARAMSVLKDLDETDKWKKAGFKERMTEIPSQIEITDMNGDHKGMYDVESEDVIEFLDSLGVKLSEEQLEDLKYNDVLPYEIFNEDTLSDFEEYMNNSDKVRDYLDDIYG